MAALDADTMVGLARQRHLRRRRSRSTSWWRRQARAPTRSRPRWPRSRIELMANVENLTYTGIDADQFVGTGNSGNNIITGGDLDDTLSGLGGNDTLQRRARCRHHDRRRRQRRLLRRRCRRRGDETAALAAARDRVESDIDYTLGADVENLDLNGARGHRHGQRAQQRHQRQRRGQPAVRRAAATTRSTAVTATTCSTAATATIPSTAATTTTPSSAAPATTPSMLAAASTPSSTMLAGFGDDVINSFDATGGTPANQDRSISAGWASPRRTSRRG